MTQLLEGNDGISGSAFADRLEPYRRELHVHCYRMLGSFDGASELVEETLVRAWTHRERLDCDPRLRAWLYRIATNACLDALGRSVRRTSSPGSVAELSLVQPYPDRPIDLAYVAALQLLPPRQRAALILRDVLGWSLRETAGLLDTTIVAADSALQRARAGMQTHLPACRNESSATELSVCPTS
jgi:RNA polymerase sigma-70 factor (ECF subfamily)